MLVNDYDNLDSLPANIYTLVKQEVMNDCLDSSYRQKCFFNLDTYLPWT